MFPLSLPACLLLERGHVGLRTSLRNTSNVVRLSWVKDPGSASTAIMCCSLYIYQSLCCIPYTEFASWMCEDPLSELRVFFAAILPSQNSFSWIDYRIGTSIHSSIRPSCQQSVCQCPRMRQCPPTDTQALINATSAGANRRRAWHLETSVYTTTQALYRYKAGMIRPMQNPVLVSTL